MKTHAFQLTFIFLIFGIAAIVTPTVVFADAHEAEGEMEHESEAMEEKPDIAGWFQIDVDSLGTYFLIGASHPIGDISIASNIYVNDKDMNKNTGEFDLGVNIPVALEDSASLQLQPMVGIGFDYSGADGPDALYPQFFAFLNAPNIYFFHWTIASVHTIFDDTTVNDIYNRTFLTYALNETISIGPQFESGIGLGDETELWSMTFGARINIGYGKSNILGLYFGYETQKEEEETGLTGRMNFTRFW